MASKKRIGPIGAAVATVTATIIYALQPNYIVITKGGHYTGTFTGDATHAAIWVQTNDSVFIDSPTINVDAAGGVKMSGGTKVIITNARFKGIKPTGSNQYGRAIDNYQPNYFYMSHFDIDSTAGILFDHNKDGVSPLIQMYYGNIRNVLMLKGDGSVGPARAGIQFNTVRNMNPASEAQWIEIRNEAGKSRVEDCVNFYNSSNFRLSNFCIYGAYGYPVSQKGSISGITVDGSMAEGNNKATASHNFEAWNGYIISTFNASVNIAAGYNNRFHDIVMITSGMLPDGTKSPDGFWSGTCIFNGNKYPDSIFFGNSIAGNTIGFVNNGNENYPYKGRQDENKDRNVNKMPIGGNTFLPDRPITLAMEDSLYGVWKVKSAPYKLGVVSGNVTPPVVVVPVVNPPVDTVKPVPIQVTIHDTVRLRDTLYAIPKTYDYSSVKPN